MKLECPVVRDLYVLYKENELSGEVREAVDQHLEGCEDCRHIYDSESNFNDILKKEPEKQPSKKLDDKMKLKLKISRLRIALLFIAVILIAILYSNYSQSRHNLMYDLPRAERTLYDISFMVNDIKNDNAPIGSFISNLDILDSQQNDAIKRDLNLFEKSQLKKFPNGLYMNFRVDKLYNILKTRHMNGTFTDRDEKAYSLLKEYMAHLTKTMSDERLNLNKLDGDGKLQALIRPINIKGIAGDFEKLNELALLYTEYDKLPGEISPMSDEEIKTRLKSTLNLDNPDKIILQNTKPDIALNGNCTFDINQGSIHYSGKIDAYTGNFESLLSNIPDKEGELLPLDEVKARLLNFLERVYGKGQSFNVQYLGINYHFSSNTDLKVYSFKLSPLINGLRVNTELNIYCNARTGDLYNMDDIGNNFIPPSYSVDTTIKITPSDGLKNLNISDKSKYSYSETMLIKSLLSGKYVPVHVYKGENDSVYVNTITGKQEFTY